LKKIAVTILNQKLSADLLNPKVVKKYQAEIDKVTERANDKEGKTDEEVIVNQCEAVIEMVDNIFGKGSAKKVLGEETDLLTCLQAYWEMTRMYKNQVVPYMNKEIAKMKAGEK
jgi:acetyl-CoA carboxylase beta subunit